MALDMMECLAGKSEGSTDCIAEESKVDEFIKF